MYIRTLVLALIFALTYGCSSGVKHEQPAVGESTVGSEIRQLSEVTISLTSEAKSKVAENLKFDEKELLDHVKRALDANSLLMKEPDDSGQILEIEVKDFRVRSNFSAVMWGFMAGSDSITGDIVLRNELGDEVDRFEVSVAYALGGIGGGQDETRMSWLYEKFAEETLNELTRKK